MDSISLGDIIKIIWLVPDKTEAWMQICRLCSLCSLCCATLLPWIDTLYLEKMWSGVLDVSKNMYTIDLLILQTRCIGDFVKSIKWRKVSNCNSLCSNWAVGPEIYLIISLSSAAWSKMFIVNLGMRKPSCSCQQVKALKHYSCNDFKAWPDVIELKGGSVAFLQVLAKPEGLRRSASFHSGEVLIAGQGFCQGELEVHYR